MLTSKTNQQKHTLTKRTSNWLMAFGRFASVTLRTGVHNVDIHFFGATIGGLQKGELQVHLLRCGVPEFGLLETKIARSLFEHVETHIAEHSLKQLFWIDGRVETLEARSSGGERIVRIRIETARLTGTTAERVILFALGVVAQTLVRFGDLLKLFGRLRIFVCVRMVLFGQLVVGLFDLLLTSALRHVQYLVVVFAVVLARMEAGHRLPMTGQHALMHLVCGESR